MSIEIKIARLAYGGDGVSTLESGKTVFVKGAMPGDIVEADIIDEQKRYDTAVATKIIEPSPDRVRTPCPYAGLCGGCPWQMIGYDTQLEWKRRFVVDSLERIGSIPGAEQLVGECVESKRKWNHRNKIELVPSMKGNKLMLGYHAQASEDIIPIEKCMLLPKSHEKDAKSLAGALRYLKASEFGLQRVGIRYSRRTSSMQVSLWMDPGSFPRKAAADVLKSAVKYDSLVRVLVKPNAKRDKISGTEMLAGDEYWHEILHEREMLVSAPSFFQVNTSGADKLIELVTEGLDLKPNDICCDLYCGVGTFTLPLAEKCDTVFAVESAGSSVRDLRRNLIENDLYAEVIGGDAVRESKQIGHVDKLVVDPPYSGMGNDIFEGISKLSPRKIALVSCNPTTLARDLQGMLDLGYHIDSITPVDLFPQTYHVETVSLLSKLKEK